MKISQVEFIEKELVELERVKKLFREIQDEEGFVVYFGDNTFFSNLSGMVKRESLAFVPEIFKEKPEIEFNVFCRDPFTGGVAVALPSFILVKSWANYEISVVEGKIDYLSGVLEILKKGDKNGKN